MMSDFKMFADFRKSIEFHFIQDFLKDMDQDFFKYRYSFVGAGR